MLDETRLAKIPDVHEAHRANVARRAHYLESSNGDGATLIATYRSDFRQSDQPLHLWGWLGSRRFLRPHTENLELAHVGA